MTASQSSPLPARPLPLAAAWLRQSIGLDPDSIGSTTIARMVARRMESCGETDERRYVGRLASDAEERDRLIDEAVVPESWFFRDAPLFDFLGRFAVALAAAPDRPAIRILSLPCAAGEEPYSVAIALLEAGLPAHRFRIEAADVSRAALAKAHAATYSPNAFRATDASFRGRWFRQSGGAHVLDEAIRNQVHFFPGNLLDESFPADRGPYDVVFCRNLLIYLTAEARAQAERTLDRLVAPEGLLVLGATEPPILKGNWIPAAPSAAFTVRRGRSPAPSPAAGETLPFGARSTDSVPPVFPPEPTAPPAPAPAPPEPPAGADALEREVERLAAAGRPTEAIAACERHLRTIGPSPQAFFLLAMLHQAGDALDQAESCLEKTLYLDGNHEEALLALSALATRRGDEPRAERYRRTATRVRSRRGGAS